MNQPQPLSLKTAPNVLEVLGEMVRKEYAREAFRKAAHKAFYIDPDQCRFCKTCGATALDSIGCILNDHAVDLRPFPHEQDSTVDQPKKPRRLDWRTWRERA